MRRFESAGCLFCAAFVLLISGAAQAQITGKELAGKLVEINGKFTQPLGAPAVAVPKYIALYYGASWCGPCHKFTPDLVAFYNEMRPRPPKGPFPRFPTQKRRDELSLREL